MSVSNVESRSRTVSEGGGVLDSSSWKLVSHKDCLARLREKKLSENTSKTVSPKTVSIALSPETIPPASPHTVGSLDQKIGNVWEKIGAISNSSDLWPRGQKV